MVLLGTLLSYSHWKKQCRKEFDSQVYTSRKKRTCKRRNKARSARWFEPFLALSCILLCKRCISIWWIHLNTVSSFIKKICESINILVCQMAWGLESSWKSLERLCVIYRTCCVISRVNKYIFFMLSYQILYHYYSNEQIRSSICYLVAHICFRSFIWKKVSSSSFIKKQFSSNPSGLHKNI